jgi:hypothetical protein
MIALALIVDHVDHTCNFSYSSTIYLNKQFAAIFSGWITSVVAFYFYGQSNAQTQSQIKMVTQSAAILSRKQLKPNENQATSKALLQFTQQY